MRTELDVQDAVRRYLEGLTASPMTEEQFNKAFPHIAGKFAAFERSFADLAQRATNRRFSLNGGGESEDGPPSKFLREQAGKWFLGVAKHRTDWRQEAEAALGIGKVAFQEDVSAEGGFAVPKPMADFILRVAALVGAVRGVSRVIPMTSKTLDIPNLANEPSVAIVAEEGSIPDSIPANPLGQVTLTAKKIAAFETMSLEVEEDNAAGLGDVLLTVFAEKIAAMEDLQALEGDGAGNNFVGLFTAAGVNAVAAGGALTNLDKFIDAWAALPSGVQQGEPLTWVMHPKTWAAIRKLKATTNDYIVTPLPVQGTPYSLHGIPVRLTDQISVARGAGSDTTAYLGAFNRGMIIGDRRRLSIDTNPYSKFQTAQVDVRVLERVGILVGIPKCFTKVTGITVT